MPHESPLPPLEDTATFTPLPRGPYQPHEIRDLTREALTTDVLQSQHHARLIAVYSPKRPLHLGANEPSVGGTPREFEVLMRLRTQEGGVIGALPVIDAAREQRMLPELDHRMLQIACIEGMQRKLLKRAFSPTRISWNTSAETLEEPDFAQRVLDTLDEQDFPPSRLAVEIHEEASSLQALGKDRVLRQLRELMRTGVQLHADDLPNHASCEIARRLFELRRLSRMSVPVGLKVDYHVTRAMREGDEQAEAAFEEIFAMASQESEVIITAEGAEIGTPKEVETRFALWALLHRSRGKSRSGQDEPLVLLQGGLPQRLVKF